MFHALGTLNIITIYSDESKKEKIYAIVEYIENYIKEIDDKFSVFKNTSEITSINNNAGKKFITVSKNTFEVLKLSKDYGDLTQGIFDITVKPYNDLIKNKENSVKVNNNSINVNYNDIILNENNQSVMLKNKGQGIDLGGIAKGFVIDKIVEILKENEITNAIINLGGTVFNVGKKRDIGIRNPFLPMNDVKKDIPILTIKSENEIFVTSGLYEQKEHIINPKTGKTVNTKIISITIIGNNGIKQDVLATSLFMLELEKSINILKKHDLQAIFIFADGKIFATDGLKKRIKMERN